MNATCVIVGSTEEGLCVESFLVYWLTQCVDKDRRSCERMFIVSFHRKQLVILYAVTDYHEHSTMMTYLNQIDTILDLTVVCMSYSSISHLCAWVTAMHYPIVGYISNPRIALVQKMTFHMAGTWTSCSDKIAYIYTNRKWFK